MVLLMIIQLMMILIQKKEGDEDRCHNLVQDIMVDINQWMCGNRLKMNPSKTEFIYFGSCQMLTKCIHNDINVCGDIVKRSAIIKLLGTLLDSNLNLKKHIISKSKTSMFNIQRIKHIRKYLQQ